MPKSRSRKQDEGASRLLSKKDFHSAVRETAKRNKASNGSNREGLGSAPFRGNKRETGVADVGGEAASRPGTFTTHKGGDLKRRKKK